MPNLCPTLTSIVQRCSGRLAHGSRLKKPKGLKSVDAVAHAQRTEVDAKDAKKSSSRKSRSRRTLAAFAEWRKLGGSAVSSMAMQIRDGDHPDRKSKAASSKTLCIKGGGTTTKPDRHKTLAGCIEEQQRQGYPLTRYPTNYCSVIRMLDGERLPQTGDKPPACWAGEGLVAFRVRSRRNTG